MSAPEISTGEKVGVVGTFQTGKTTFMRYLLERFPRALVWDPEGEFQGGPWRRVTSWGQVPSELPSGHYSFTLPLKDFSRWCNIALEAPGWAVAADEFQAVIQSPSASGIPSEWSHLWRTGHKYGTSVMWATHRLREVAPILRNTHHLIIFKQDRAHDWDLLEKEVGRDAAQALREAPEYCYLRVPSGGADPQICPPVPDPE